ncbi:MAG TPA: M1 family metallopeptidase [Gemmatimonadaceae bacterium]|nr:M1 family metallopeptidase [Gemmatimonadaceae bacterium]
MSRFVRLTTFAILGLLASPELASAQDSLYMPRAVAQAYRNGTRAKNGKPGPKYWQNRARYEITVTARPPDRTVRGTERILYVNDSPDTLRNASIRLFLNIHKPGATRDGGASPDYLTSGVHVDAFSVNGQVHPWGDDTRTLTVKRVMLPAALLPHDSVRLSIDWHYEISREGNREGMIDSTTWFLAYFYPRVAVYDDYNGWDTMPFTDTQEFYSDFNDYDVTLNVPANYVVWGTGTLTNASAVLQPAVLARFQQSMTSDSTIHVATLDDVRARRVTAAGPVNAWHFSARHIPDVAFNLRDHYVWDAGSVLVDDATRRRASVQAAYNDTAADYHHMVQYGRHALDWLSHNWPGVPYPYEKTTVVQGPAGMEYPMMANDEAYADTVFSRFVAEHEIAHTYMPFYMGINESRYAFMDEGWATTFEYLIGTADLGKERATKAFQEFRVNRWINDPSPLQDLPIITPADALHGGAYGNNAYGKPALGYLALKDMLGDSLFRTALHGYMDRWNGKHPIPWDFFNSVNDLTGRDLNWFWNRWFFSNGYIDRAIADVRKTGRRYAVTLDNIGGMPAPVDVVATWADGSTDTYHQTSAIWQTNARRAVVNLPAQKVLRSLALSGGIWVDADSTNDHWPRAH